MAYFWNHLSHEGLQVYLQWWKCWMQENWIKISFSGPTKQWLSSCPVPLWVCRTTQQLQQFGHRPQGVTTIWSSSQKVPAAPNGRPPSNEGNRTRQATEEPIHPRQALLYLVGQVLLRRQILSAGHTLPVSSIQHHLLGLLLHLGHDAQPDRLWRDRRKCGIRNFGRGAVSPSYILACTGSICSAHENNKSNNFVQWTSKKW